MSVVIIKDRIRWRESIDAMVDFIDEYKSQQEIATLLDVSRFVIHEGFKRHYLLDHYYRRQEEWGNSIERRNAFQDIIRCLNQRLDQNVSMQVLSARRYWYKKKLCKENTTHANFEDVVNVFKYISDNPGKINLSAIARATGIGYVAVGSILRYSGFSHAGLRQVISPITQKRIEYSKGLGWSPGNVARYVGADDGVVYSRYSKWGVPIVRSSMILRHGCPPIRMRYIDIGFLYEAKDLGFSLNETAELSDRKTDIVEKVWELHEGFSEEIIRGLDVLFPENNPHIIPYLDAGEAVDIKPIRHRIR